MNSRSLSFLIFLVFLCLSFSAGVARASQYDIREMTPQIQQAFSARQDRYREIEQLKTAGSLGENNQGFVEARNGSPAVSATAQAENRDREVIYRAIVDQNNLGPAGMTQVKSVFAEVQREKAGSGEWVQMPSGAWVRK